MKFNEQYTIENAIIKFIQELGYEYIRAEDFSKFRQFENEFIVTSHLIDAVKKINSIDDTEAQSVVREVKKLDTNEAFLLAMRNGVNLKDPATGMFRDYKIVDFDNLENNHFVVTNQFYFEGVSENIRTDVLVFLNGLPICDIEAKSPTASSSVSFENAIDQIKRYEKVAPKLFLPNSFNIATDGLKTVYGTTYSPKQYFLTWREDPHATKKQFEDELDATLFFLLDKAKLLDILQNFIVFEKKKDGIVKKIARYQQLYATNKIVERVKEGEQKKGLIWHTQGSGKTLTMFFAAWKLRYDQELKNPKVFILIDRIDLDDQIYEEFEAWGGQNLIRVESRKDLEKKIKGTDRGIFISTIQKFNELEEIENIEGNVIVLCDEAHRDNEGVAAIKMRNAFKDAFFFGFTGTPIDKLALNTHRNFGEEGERYLDYYSIQQAIDDGATLPVTYEARLSKFFVADEEKIETQFNQLTHGLTDTQKESIAKKYGKKEALIKLDSRIAMIARDIVDHYRDYVLPNGFKAQVVCYDREATAKYKKFFDSLVPPEWSAIIYSPGDRNTDTDELQQYNTNARQREKIIEQFKDPNHPLKFLLVSDMLLTGFDAPIEQVMYLDKPLRDHNLLQAIARTNRIYPNKGCGKVIDYYGVTRNLHEALDFDESVVESAMINIKQLKDDFVRLLDEVMELFPGVNIEDPSIENLRRCLKLFISDQNKQQFFSDNYGRLKILFEILSPDPFLMSYLRKFEWVTSFYLAFTKEFQTEDIDTFSLTGYGEKIKNLIQKKIDYEGITRNFREMNIHDIATFHKLDALPEEERALNLEKMLKREISINIDTHPIFKKFIERLLAIRESFDKHQIDLSERIQRYYELMNDIKTKSNEAEELGYTLHEYGLAVISEEFIQTQDKEAIKGFIKEMTARLEEILDTGWQDSSKREEFLKEVKRTLQELILKDYKNKIKISDFHKYLNRLIDVIIKKF